MSNARPAITAIMSVPDLVNYVADGRVNIEF
jgi:hypothetical protein